MEVSTTPDPEPAESLKPASAKNTPEPDEPQEKIQEEETEVWVKRPAWQSGKIIQSLVLTALIELIR